MAMAHVVACRSTCLRLNVGAVAVVNRSIVAYGYNGSPTGEPHCGCDLSKPCTRAVHAEINVIHKLSTQPFDLYVTHSPCENCFDALLDAGVERIFFAEYYRQSMHLIQDIVPVYRVVVGGIVNLLTGELVNVKG